MAQGHQCFVVCPAVEETEELGIKSAAAWAEALQQTVFPDLRISLLHGQMKGAEKEAVMTAFARGEADVLVVAMGRRAAIGAECLRPGQIVVDVGIHVDAEGRLSGDVDFAAAEPVVEAITPVPGGVGTVTTSVLVRHVVEAAERLR